MPPPHNAAKGVPLEEAVFLYGDLPDPKRHRARYNIARLYKAIGSPENFDPNRSRWLRYAKDQFEAECRILEKLKSGTLWADGFVRGSSPDAPRTSILPERWGMLNAEFETNSASGPGIEIDDIRVFIDPEPSKYQEPARPKNKGGAPPKFDWAKFDREMLRIANLPDGLPDRPELHRHMMRFCHDTWGDKAPADSTVRDRISKRLP